MKNYSISNGIVQNLISYSYKDDKYSLILK